MLSDSSSDSLCDEKNDETDESNRYPPYPPKLDEFWLNMPKDWTYTMRREMQEVAPGLYIGPYSVASRTKLEYLLSHKITHIVCIRQAIEANIIKPNFTDNFKYLVLDVADTPIQNIIQHFQKVKSFIDDGLKSGGRVLIHGNAGISRSSAFVLAYIMETYELPLQRAFRLVQQRRFCINPSEGFMMQLKEYEPIYQAQKMKKEDNSNVQTNKRTIHEMEDSDTPRIENKTDDMMES